MKRLVLLGGGHAHLGVLRAFAREPVQGVELLVISPTATTLYSGMVPGVVAGHYTLAQALVPLQTLARAAGARLRLAAALALDAGRREITLSDGTRVPYDLLSIDVGATQDRDIVPGARQHALFVRPVEDFLQRMAPGPGATRDDAQQWAVVGAGAAGFEIALALAHANGYANRYANRYANGCAHASASAHSQGARAHACGVLVTGGGEVLSGYPVAVQRAGRAALRAAGVTVLPAACSSVETDHLVLDGRTRVPSDLTVMAVGVHPHPWLRTSGLLLDGQGFVATAPTLQSVSHPEVFAAGDASSRADAPHPRSGVHAVLAAPALAANLRAALRDQPLKAYRPRRLTLNLLSCGRRHAIAAFGPWLAQGAWVWWWKDAIDRRFVARMSRSASG